MIEQVKFQLWPLDKKLRVINTAREYVRRHESEMQEKFAQKRTFGTVKQQFQFLMIRMLQVRMSTKHLFIHDNLDVADALEIHQGDADRVDSLAATDQGH